MFQRRLHCIKILHFLDRDVVSAERLVKNKQETHHDMKIPERDVT